MDEGRLTGYVGSSAVVGGTAWASASLVQATLPQGCVATACLSSVGYEGPTGLVLMLVVGLMLVAVSGTGLVVLVGRRGILGPPGVLGAAVGAVACAVGFAVLAAGPLRSLVFVRDLVEMPFATGLGVVALLAGLGLVGWVAVGCGVLPRSVGAFVLLGDLMLMGEDERVPQVVFAVLGGLSWCAAGLVLLRSHVAERRRTALPA